MSSRSILELVPGSIFDGTYQIMAPLGVGGMASVFLVRHIAMDKIMALKVLRDTGADGIQLNRFKNEARSIAKIKHPHIVEIYNFGIYEEPSGRKLPYLVMEVLEGRSLDNVLLKDGPLAPEMALGVVEQVAEAMQAAHAQGIVHRDMKPANIMLLADKRSIKVLDFGVAKGQSKQAQGLTSQSLTAHGEIVGSPLYMSPEQLMGDAVDERGDIYSLGVTFYELLVGRPPFLGRTLNETAAMHFNADTPSVAPTCGGELGEALDQFISYLMAKDRADRCPDMQSVQADAQAISRQFFARDRMVLRSIASEARASRTTRPMTVSHREKDLESMSDPDGASDGVALAGSNKTMWLLLGLVTVLVVTGGAFFVINGIGRSAPKFAYAKSHDVDNGTAVLVSSTAHVVSKLPNYGTGPQDVEPDLTAIDVDKPTDRMRRANVFALDRLGRAKVFSKNPNLTDRFVTFNDLRHYPYIDQIETMELGPTYNTTTYFSQLPRSVVDKITTCDLRQIFATPDLDSQKADEAMLRTSKFLATLPNLRLVKFPFNPYLRADGIIDFFSRIPRMQRIDLYKFRGDQFLPKKNQVVMHPDHLFFSGSAEIYKIYPFVDFSRIKNCEMIECEVSADDLIPLSRQDVETKLVSPIFVDHTSRVLERPLHFSTFCLALSLKSGVIDDFNPFAPNLERMIQLVEADWLQIQAQDLDVKTAKRFSYLMGVKKMTMRGFEMAPGALLQLGSMPRLKELELVECKIPPVDIVNLARSHKGLKVTVDKRTSHMSSFIYLKTMPPNLSQRAIHMTL
ncbi:MAG: serine/threonine protein kinase [Candidatus Obscuribacterales bacterium]|nr:serine/threonine protein kinase [Candidatus Obscuribacterales bacterium]